MLEDKTVKDDNVTTGSIKVKKYARKPFFVDAVQVTSENIQEVAAWCDGELRHTNKKSPDQKNETQYIKVRVHRALVDRQTMAFVGDWVLYAGTGYKVYTSNAFNKSFEVRPTPPKEMN